jgi:hypothetical protein
VINFGVLWGQKEEESYRKGPEGQRTGCGPGEEEREGENGPSRWKAMALEKPELACRGEGS